MFYDQEIRGKRILLHTCCGPCALGAIEPLLADGASVTLYYYNPNIFEGEFEKRLEALDKVVEHFSLELVVPEHDHAAFTSLIAGHEDEPEGGERCGLCMGERIQNAAVYAAEHGFDAYSTTLTVSPHKSSKLIFSLAQALDDKGIGAPFLARDFKKRGGFLRSCELARELNIYRQRFCGCEASCSGAGIDVAAYSAIVRAEYADIADIRSKAW